MSSMNQLKRHGGGTADGIEIAAGSTKTAFTAKRHNFEIITMLTGIKGVPIMKVATRKHFIDIFKNGITNGNTAAGKGMKMIIKNLL